jgi:hypothetical protein
MWSNTYRAMCAFTNAPRTSLPRSLSRVTGATLYCQWMRRNDGAKSQCNHDVLPSNDSQVTLGRLGLAPFVKNAGSLPLYPAIPGGSSMWLSQRPTGHQNDI